MYQTATEAFATLERFIDTGGEPTDSELIEAVGDEAANLVQHLDSLCRDWALNGLRAGTVYIALRKVAEALENNTLGSDVLDEKVVRFALERCRELTS